jgi:hypothetical protein
MQRLWSFLGVDPLAPGLETAVADAMGENPDADWQQQKAEEIVSPLQKGQHGSWRELFTERDRQAFKSIAGEALIHWGYEKDLDW